MKTFITSVALIIAALVSSVTAAEKKIFSPATERKGPIERWESLRFGGFLCFNSNQFSGREYCVITDPKTYNPTRLDVRGWIETYRSAGMKYAVLTVRHTSGFLLWDSATTDFDVANSGNTTDVVREFVAECRRQGLAPGLYYCLWGGKQWKPSPAAKGAILAQLHELATRYGDITYFWIDMMHWAPPDLSTQEIYNALKNDQPETVVIVNQGWGDGQKIKHFPTDVIDGEVTFPPPEGHNPRRTIDGVTYYLPFEFCTVSQGRVAGDKTLVAPLSPKDDCWFTYGSGRGFQPSRPIEPESLCRYIRGVYRRGASNVLLAAGPDHTGAMRPEDVRQLKQLGKLLVEEKP